MQCDIPGAIIGYRKDGRPIRLQAGGAPLAPAPNSQQSASPSSAAMVPFQVGSFHYAEQLASDTYQLQANAQEFVHNITPGGFLRGVDLLISSTGGVAGSATADNPFAAISNISIENIDGSPILYPMNGFAYAMVQKFFNPWLGDPQVGPYYSQGLNPGFLLHLWPELYGTAGVLANTDARAQYRVRYTLAPVTSVGTGYTTAPTVTGVEFMQAWAQPDRADLHGNPVEPIPPGLALARIVRHQVVPLNAAGATNLIQLANTGNEIRGIILIVRDASNVRQNYLTGPIRIRLDDRSMGVYTVQELNDLVYRFYQLPQLSVGTGLTNLAIPTGVYVIPRFNSTQPVSSSAGADAVFGQYWLPTSNATYLTIEAISAAGATTGTIEIITDEVVPVSDAGVPSALEGI